MSRNEQRWLKSLKEWLGFAFLVSAFMFFVLMIVEAGKENIKEVNTKITKCVEIVQNINLSEREQLLFIMLCKEQKDIAYEIMKEMQDRQVSD